MDERLLTFYCSTVDRDVVAETLRALSDEPVHVRPQDVLGRDFSDAHAGEQVRGNLQRTAVELVVAASQVEGTVAAIAGCRRSRPVRWHVTPLMARGRIE